MEITITLPSGKDLSFTKGVNGVTKLFTTNYGEVVVVKEGSVTKFGNYPFVVQHTKEIDADE